jgi:hypothetical protein
MSELSGLAQNALVMNDPKELSGRRQVVFITGMFLVSMFIGMASDGMMRWVGFGLGGDHLFVL